MHTHKLLIVTAHTLSGLFWEFFTFISLFFSALLLYFQMIACNLVRARRFRSLFFRLPLHLILV